MDSRNKPSTRMSHGEVRTLALASLGGALEFYDFVVFVFFASTIGHLFFPPGLPEWVRQVQTFGLFAAGYLIRPIGGLLMAHFGDRDGRKRMFTLSVLLMAVPTLLIGFLPTYEVNGPLAPIALLLMRLLQGAAIGGEAPGGWVFVAEHAGPNRLGLAVGLLTSGLAGGIFMGSLVATLLNYAVSPERITAGFWRLPFFLGGIAGFGAMFLRRWLEETPVFLAMRAESATARAVPAAIVLRSHRAGVVASMASTWMLTAAIVIVILVAPTLLQKQFAIPATTVLHGNLAGTVSLTIGVVLMGIIYDRLGFRAASLIGTALLAVTGPLLFLGAGYAPAWLPVFYVLAGLGASAVTLTPLLMIRAFPSEVAFTGLSMSYNLAYALFGGTTPLLIAYLAHLDRFSPGYYVAIVAAIGLLACWLAPVASTRPDVVGMAKAAPK